MTSWSLWNYYRDEINNVDISDNVWDGKSFEYKTKISRETPKRPQRRPQPPQNSNGSQPP